MSGRIRSIKPEILEDEVTAGLGHVAFRLFIGFICLADDYGRLRADPRYLVAQVLWARTCPLDEFKGALAELEPLVLFYEVGGQKYAEIRNWSKHQKVQHPGKPRVPPPPETLTNSSGESHRTLTGAREGLTPDHGPGPDPKIGDPDPEIRTSTHAREVPSQVDLTKPAPDWFVTACETVKVNTGETFSTSEAWLSYAGHRMSKGEPLTPQHATYWVTRVMVPEARKTRLAPPSRASNGHSRDRPEPPKLTTEQARAEAKSFAERLRRKVTESGTTGKD